MKLNLNYESSSHVPVLDAIRGLAVLLVLIYHFFSPYIKILHIGWIGVDMFFVLSGFLITGILYDSKEKPRYFKNFYLKRVLRIFPLYYMSLFVILILLPFLMPTEEIKGYEYITKNQFFFWTYLQNWMASFDLLWPKGTLVSHFWSLAIEEQFYIFWPFLIYFLPNKSLVWISLVVVILAFSTRFVFVLTDQPTLANYVNTIARIDGLALGAITAILMRRNQAILSKYVLSIFGAASLMLVIVFFQARSLSFYNPVIQLYGFSVIAIFFASFLVISLSDLKLIKHLVDLKIFRIFGKYSYGLYVYHVFLLTLFLPVLSAYLQGFLASESQTMLMARILLLLMTFLVAYVSFHFFEARLLKLKKLLH